MLERIKNFFDFRNRHIIGAFIFKRYKSKFAMLIIFTFISTGLEMISIGTIIPLFNVVFGNNDLTQSHGWIVDSLYSFFRLFPQEKLFMMLLVFFLLVTIIKVGFKAAREIIKTILTLKVQVDCQKEMYKKYAYSDLNFFIRNKTGDLIFRILNLPREVATYFRLLPSLFVEIVNVVILSVLLFTVSSKLFMGMIVLGVVYGSIIHIMSKDFFEKLGRRIPKALARQNIIAHESLGGIREVVVWGKQNSWVRRFFESCGDYYNLKKRVTILRLIPGNILEILIIGGICLVGIFYGRTNMDKFVSMVPVLAVYTMALVRMTPSFSKIGQERLQLATYRPSAELYEKLLREDTKIYIDGEKEFTNFQKEIQFNNLSFAYIPGENVLEKINITIPCKKTVAVVGSSGGGKTTLVDLLLGLYQADEGAILVDGENLDNFKILSWRKKIGIVSQNSFIFNASAKENIAFDFHDINDDKVKEVAKVAGAHEFIEGMEKGYDTILGDRGYRLSGGQRQRIAIARALYNDPEIIIFDEATSALDNRTEKMIADMISSLSNKKTIIILAHRLSTIRNSDIIFVLKNKKVAQMGTHEELLKQKGEYSNLYLNEGV